MAEMAREKDETSLPALHIDALIKADLKFREDVKKEDMIEAYNKLIQHHPDFFDGYRELFESCRFFEVLRPDQNSELKPYQNIDFDDKYERAKKCPCFDPIIYTVEIKNVSMDDEEAYYENQERTRQIYERIIREDPSHADIKFKLAELCLNSNEILKPLLEDQKEPYRNYAAQYTENLYRQGKFDEAEVFLDEYTRNTGKYIEYYEEMLLGNLKSRSPGDKVKILSNIPFVVQKGLYCGPASISMIMQYWGKKIDQEDIGEKVFNKGMGSVMCSMKNYVENQGFRTMIFSPSKKAWKKLLDQDVPVLVSKSFLGQGHAVVLSGYDDIAENFIFHDPDQFLPLESGYSLPEDNIIEKINYCLLIVPEDKYEDYDLSEIETSFAIIH